jgi:hypothetical protein
MNGERRSVEAGYAWSWLALFLLVGLKVGVKPLGGQNRLKPRLQHSRSNDHDGQIVIWRYSQLDRSGL